MQNYFVFLAWDRADLVGRVCISFWRMRTGFRRVIRFETLQDFKNENQTLQKKGLQITQYLLRLFIYQLMLRFACLFICGYKQLPLVGHLLFWIEKLLFLNQFHIYQTALAIMRSDLELEENSSLQNENSYSNSSSSNQSNKLEQSKILKILIHLKDNRIFYFIVVAIILVFIAILQIRSAYRSYEDNERLVKLWLQEKELKDMMSQKNKEIKEAQVHPKNKFGFNSSKVYTSTRLKEKKDIQHAQTEHHQEKILPGFASNRTKIPLKQPQLKVFTRHQEGHQLPGAYERIRPVAGITRVQANAAAKWRELSNQDLFNTTHLSEEQLNYYEQKYQISNYEQLPFCIVIPSYNNAKNARHIRNIKSIIMQNYSNYHVVFIDDASTDSTGKDVQQFMANQTKLAPEKYIIIKNKEQQRAMPNLRRAARQFCKPYEIYLIIDGDDELIGRQVLKLFNSVFQKEQAWFVYSNFLTIRGNVGYSRPFPATVIKNNTYRRYPFVTSHLRAFYTQLFLNIKEADLKDDSGNYLKAANDVAICLPILEQSHEKVFYLKQLTYYYNSNTGQNNHQLRLKQQRSNDKMLRKRQSYPSLETFYVSPADGQKKNGTK